MAKGRKPTPTEVLKDQDTYRADRHANRVFIAETLSDQPVEWLTPEEKLIWTKWYAYLQKNDILKETDEVAFGLLCKVFRRVEVLSSEFKNTGDYITEYTSDRGSKSDKTNPKYVVMDGEEKKLLRLLTEFGMTPASRNKIKTAVQEGEDPFEAAMRMA